MPPFTQGDGQDLLERYRRAWERRDVELAMELFGDDASPDAQSWLSRYRARTESEDLSGLNKVNPKYVLRNWVAETAIRAVEDRGDIATLDRIFKLVQAPFEKHSGDEAFAAPPPPELCDLEVSCSS